MELSDVYYIESEGHNLIYHTKEESVVSSGTMKSVETAMENLIYHTKEESVVSSGTMKSVETAMEGMDFSRINKCYLVNLEHVDGVQDKYAIVHGDRLLISRPRTKQFMQELTRYWGERS